MDSSALENLCCTTELYHLPAKEIYSTKGMYSSAPIFMGNMFQDLPRLRETADNTERYI
jgi:hypothetical protein